MARPGAGTLRLARQEIAVRASGREVGGKASLVVPQGTGFTIRATDARGSTASLTAQTFSSSTASATLTITP